MGGGGGGQISPSPIDFHRRPYNTLALPCERVMQTRLRPTPQVAGDRSVCGVGRNLVFMSVNWSQFLSRNQLPRSVRLTVHYSAGVSRNSAVTCTSFILQHRRQSAVLAGHRHEACLLDTCFRLLYMTWTIPLLPLSEDAWYHSCRFATRRHWRVRKRLGYRLLLMHLTKLRFCVALEILAYMHSRQAKDSGERRTKNSIHTFTGRHF